MCKWAFIAVVAVIDLVGCAKPPTDVLTTVSVDATVPPLRILRTTISGAPGQVSGAVRSIASAVGDASDRPGPFAFPLQLPVGADPAFAGAVTITVDGLDWDTQAVVATGSASAEVVAEHETQAALTLTAVSSAAGADGGAPEGADGGD